MDVQAVIPPPLSLIVHSINVPHKTLMGPGPANASSRVLAASALPMLGHLHKEFVSIMDECKAGIQYLFQTTNRLTLAASGTGHAAMEMACSNMVDVNDKVLILVSGIWGTRFAEMTRRQGGTPVELNKPGETFTCREIEKALIQHKPKVLFVTHGESSSALLQNLEGIGPLCHRYDCILIVDSVAAAGGVPLLMDKWEIDVLYTGGQKCLGAPPGASPISFSDRAWSKFQRRQKRPSSYYLDLAELANYWGCDGKPRRYHHTAPISNVYALRESLAILAEETLEKCWARHRLCAKLLHTEIQKIGLKLCVNDERSRLPTVTGVLVPQGINWKDVTSYMMNKYNLEISGGLGHTAGKIWRIGLMGVNATPENVKFVIKSLEEALEVIRRRPRSKL